LVQRGMRERGSSVVEAQQAWDVDDAVVHLATLGAPRNLGAQRLEELVRARHPARERVDPGARVQFVALDPLERPDPYAAVTVEQGALEPHGPRVEQMFD